MLINRSKSAALIAGAAFFLSAATAPASADEVFSSSNQSPSRIVVRVDISEQKMTVIQDGQRVHTWPVSTARPGKITPRGTFQPQVFSPNHRSSLYNNAPMPWSVFYSGHYAIHGTDAINRLGQPASAGCVRLHPDNAKVLYSMIRNVGKQDTYIVVQE
ncbi:L,D-transpeptidase [Maritimibacter dapengensis]|uniref:L,D-transpeptidase n=1 Tax=Maritimibacter dapengensis TaxID=2836868 RepID=A0ABS6T2T6_9RHOB|nr:L,D-transpeptidase [Maritimibacter dapengensis]MBV7378836.1 L,D-transpeptidase [Maritimibacter dapengensis]